MNGRNQQRDQTDHIKELIRKLESKAITDFTEREIFPPNGHASKVVKEAGVSSVQLRKVFQEFKAIVDGLRKDNNLEKAMGRLYKLYALLEYQAERGVLDKNFKNLMFELFDNIERHKSPKAFERAYDLLMAMVAYSKKS
jgi:hypothetical protein